jgi:hypothetical protein
VKCDTCINQSYGINEHQANVSEKQEVTHLDGCEKKRKEGACVECVTSFKNLSSSGPLAQPATWSSSFLRGRGRRRGTVKISQLPLAVIRAGCFHWSPLVQHFVSALSDLIHALPYSAISFCIPRNYTTF